MVRFVPKGIVEAEAKLLCWLNAPGWLFSNYGWRDVEVFAKLAQSSNLRISKSAQEMLTHPYPSIFEKELARVSEAPPPRVTNFTRHAHVPKNQNETSRLELFQTALHVIGTAKPGDQYLRSFTDKVFEHGLGDKNFQVAELVHTTAIELGDVMAPALWRWTRSSKGRTYEAAFKAYAVIARNTDSSVAIRNIADTLKSLERDASFLPLAFETLAHSSHFAAVLESYLIEPLSRMDNQLRFNTPGRDQENDDRNYLIGALFEWLGDASNPRIIQFLVYLVNYPNSEQFPLYGFLNNHRSSLIALIAGSAENISTANAVALDSLIAKSTPQELGEAFTKMKQEATKRFIEYLEVRPSLECADKSNPLVLAAKHAFFEIGTYRSISSEATPKLVAVASKDPYLIDDMRALAMSKDRDTRVDGLTLLRHAWSILLNPVRYDVFSAAIDAYYYGNELDQRAAEDVLKIFQAHISIECLFPTGLDDLALRKLIVVSTVLKSLGRLDLITSKRNFIVEPQELCTACLGILQDSLADFNKVRVKAALFHLKTTNGFDFAGSEPLFLTLASKTDDRDILTALGDLAKVSNLFKLQFVCLIRMGDFENAFKLCDDHPEIGSAIEYAREHFDSLQSSGMDTTTVERLRANFVRSYDRYVSGVAQRERQMEENPEAIGRFHEPLTDRYGRLHGKLRRLEKPTMPPLKLRLGRVTG